MSESLFYAAVGLVFIFALVLAAVYSIIMYRIYKKPEVLTLVTRKNAEPSNTALLGVVMPRQERREEEDEK